MPTRVFDDVGGRWLAVGLGSHTCENAPAEAWVVVTLQPRPDGILFGESSTTTSGKKCAAAKQAVTFTRTGDVDINNLPDPASQPPRVVSPAEALHGRYHDTLTSTEGMKTSVRTDCLRTGDRCMSYFHSPDSVAPLVFGSGKWTWNVESDAPCSTGGSAPAKVTAEYPLPEPPQNPITLLTGHGRLEGPCAYIADLDDKYVRTGKCSCTNQGVWISANLLPLLSRRHCRRSVPRRRRPSLRVPRHHQRRSILGCCSGACPKNTCTGAQVAVGAIRMACEAISVRQAAATA